MGRKQAERASSGTTAKQKLIVGTRAPVSYFFINLIFLYLTTTSYPLTTLINIDFITIKTIAKVMPTHNTSYLYA